MSNKSESRRKIEEHCFASGKYTPDAYEFITRSVIDQVSSLSAPRHLSAREVLQGVQDQLTDSFGFLAVEILRDWKIRTASDIGEIIFDLIALGILAASEDDKRSDFDIDFVFFPPRTQSAAPRQLDINVEIPKID